MRALLTLIASFWCVCAAALRLPDTEKRSAKRDPESTPREKATNPLCRALVTMIASESRNVQGSPLLLLLLLCALLLVLLLLVLSNPSLQETQSLSMPRGSCCTEA
jgi:hypothetical protein